MAAGADRGPAQGRPRRHRHRRGADAGGLFRHLPPAHRLLRGVTGSHNPPDYNGFKIVVDGETLSGDAIQNLYARIAENRLHRAEGLGLLSSRDIKRRLHPAHRRRHPDRAQAQGRGRLRQRRRRRDRARAAGGDRRRGRAAVLRRRRHVPEPPPGSQRPGQPGRPDQRGAAHRRRHRPGASTATATASAWSPRPARSSIPTAC